MVGLMLHMIRVFTRDLTQADLSQVNTDRENEYQEAKTQSTTGAAPTGTLKVWSTRGEIHTVVESQVLKNC